MKGFCDVNIIYSRTTFVSFHFIDLWLSAPERRFDFDKREMVAILRGYKDEFSRSLSEKVCQSVIQEIAGCISEMAVPQAEASGAGGELANLWWHRFYALQLSEYTVPFQADASTVDELKILCLAIVALRRSSL